MNWKELIEKARLKLEAAKALLEGDAPDMAAVKALREEADALKVKAAEIKAIEVGLAEFDAPATNDAGIVVTGDEADRKLEDAPFKSMGEFLITLARGTDKRLPALASKEPGLAGFTNMTKAIGGAKIGSLAQARMNVKAATGLSEGVPSAGGFLVGTDRNATIMARVYNTGEILRRVDMVPISANSNGMTFYGEDETSRATGSRRGGIRAYHAAEASEKTASKPKFREMALKLQKIIGLVYATDELLADARALEGWIMNNLPEELRFVAEDDIINGTGAGMALGILNSGCLVSVAKESGQTAATIVAENISKMWARRWIGARDYIWLINQDVEPELDNLNLAVGTGGSLVYMPPGGLADAPYGRIKGRSVITVEYCATLGTVGDIILASMGEYQSIEKGGIEAASSIHVRFVYDEQVFRFVMRTDGQPKWSSVLTPFKGTNTVSPFVALAARA